MSRPQFDLIVFSHLRWEFVTQRPQHLITRLAQGRRVLFIEEPVDKTRVIKVKQNLHVLQPGIDRNKLIDQLASMVGEYRQKLKIENPVAWFYSAAFVEILDKITDFNAVVYDCMDELSAFAGAPKALIRQEKRLLKQADVVFTGGKSLYEAKAQLHPNVYCFPSSVDRKHFAKALSAATKVPVDLKNIPAPTVGYIGVIDERIDLKLLDKSAKSMPETNFVMIGPVVKIAEKDLPRQPNIHYLGGKPYAQLPNYLKGLDLAMMPFALNRSTKFISPTKTPEFMAAGKPVISTAVKDVVRDYSKVVTIIKDAKQFTAAIKKYLQETAAQRKTRLQSYNKILKQMSWDKTATAMEKAIEQVLTQKA